MLVEDGGLFAATMPRRDGSTQITHRFPVVPDGVVLRLLMHAAHLGRRMRFEIRRCGGAVIPGGGKLLGVSMFVFHDGSLNQDGREMGAVRTVGVANSRPTIALANR